MIIKILPKLVDATKAALRGKFKHIKGKQKKS